MASGSVPESQPDILTAWEVAALNLLITLDPAADWDVKATRENMLALMQALDRGDLDPALADSAFMSLTEALILALLRGERIEVRDPSTYAGREAIFAAAQVIYNQAVMRGSWKLHPDIRRAMGADE